MTENERAASQEFAVEIECPTDARRAAATDDIAAALDYRALAACARRVVEGPPRQLVETLAEQIATDALAQLPISWVRVRVTKLHPGSLPGPATIEVRRERRGARAEFPYARPTVELHVPDFAPARDFYGRLGFAVVREERGEDGYLKLQLDRNCIAFWPGSAAVARHSYFRHFPPHTRRGLGVEIVLEVDGVDALFERAREIGAIETPLARRRWGARDFRLADPYGFYLRFTEPLDTPNI